MDCPQVYLLNYISCTVTVLLYYLYYYTMYKMASAEKCRCWSETPCKSDAFVCKLETKKIYIYKYAF